MKVYLAVIMVISFQLFARAQSPAEYLDFAIKYTEEQKYDEAIKVCNKLLKMLPSNPDIFYLRGVNYFLKSDYETAIINFDSAININSGFSDAYLYRAKSKRALKNYWGALRDYNRAKNENFYSTISSLAGDVIKSIFRKSEDDE